MSEYGHLKCLQPAIMEKCPVMFCWKWTISKYCTRERRLVLYAKTGNQETLPSIFNSGSWPPCVFRQVSKALGFFFCQLGLEPLTLLTGVAYELANITENSRHYWQSHIIACLHLLRKPQSRTKTLDWMTMLPAFTLVREDSCIKIGNRILVRFLGMLMFFDSHLLFLS